MSEGEVVEQLVAFINLLLVATGVFFTILSVYVAALNYALRDEGWPARTMLFLFVTLAFAMMGAILVGARAQHAGLIARLEEIAAEGGLTAAGRAALANARDGMSYSIGTLTIDELVVYLVWGALGLIYAMLIYLTFVYRWRPDAGPKSLGEPSWPSKS